MAKKKGKKFPRLNEVRSKILPMIKKEPEKSLAYFGRKCVALGLLQHPRSIYAVVHNNDYMKGEIEEIRAKNFEMMSKEIVPLALKKHKKMLKDEKLSKDQQIKVVDMAERREWGADESKRPVQPIQINIREIQMFNQARLDEKVKEIQGPAEDVIDVKESVETDQGA